MDHFKLVSEYQPTGDQPQAIAELVKGFREGNQFETLLGVTGSGKTFTMANVIAALNKPTLVIAHNKTLAGQLIWGIQGVLPGECRGVFCLLLRLLSAGGICSFIGYLYCKGFCHQ